LEKLQAFLLMAPVLLFSMVAHEYAHGYAALRQGDPTAFQLGRLTWNPLKHIDPFMTVLLPILTFVGSNGSLIFGGAKPVPVDPRNYRNYKRGDIIVSLAGIATNVVLALVCALVIVLLGVLGRALPATADTLGILQRMFINGVLVNLLLAMFNLLPIPPLDGSHVMKYLLPPAWSLRYQQFGRYGILVLVILMVSGPGTAIISFWMTPVRLALGAIFRGVSPFLLSGQLTSGL
jgi:Zn-dependent protease